MAIRIILSKLPAPVCLVVTSGFGRVVAESPAEIDRSTSFEDGVPLTFAPLMMPRDAGSETLTGAIMALHRAVRFLPCPSRPLVLLLIIVKGSSVSVDAMMRWLAVARFITCYR